jgi:hypothetical protein
MSKCESQYAHLTGARCVKDSDGVCECKRLEEEWAYAYECGCGSSRCAWCA